MRRVLFAAGAEALVVGPASRPGRPQRFHRQSEQAAANLPPGHAEPGQLGRLVLSQPDRPKRAPRCDSATEAPSTTGLLAQAGRRALLRRGAASAVLITLAAVSRRAFAANATVTIDNFAFSPTPLTVARGTIVTWENRDDIPHAIYFPALNLHSHALDTNDTFAHRFDQPGTFDYICSIHPHMRGRIVVSE